MGTIHLKNLGISITEHGVTLRYSGDCNFLILELESRQVILYPNFHDTQFISNLFNRRVLLTDNFRGKEKCLWLDPWGLYEGDFIIRYNLISINNYNSLTTLNKKYFNSDQFIAKYIPRFNYVAILALEHGFQDEENICLSIWDIDSGKLLYSHFSAGVFLGQMDISPDGNFLYYSTDCQFYELILIDVEKLEIVIIEGGPTFERGGYIGLFDNNRFVIPNTCAYDGDVGNYRYFDLQKKQFFFLFDETYSSDHIMCMQLVANVLLVIDDLKFRIICYRSLLMGSLVYLPFRVYDGAQLVDLESENKIWYFTYHNEKLAILSDDKILHHLTLEVEYNTSQDLEDLYSDKENSFAFFTSRPNNKDDIRFLDEYQPYHGGKNPYFNEFSKQILNLKAKDLRSYLYFNKALSKYFNEGATLVVIPSHTVDKKDSGIKELAMILVSNGQFEDGTNCLIRTKPIPKLATGGNRSIELHSKSIAVCDKSKIIGKNILLLDDVTTSGNSLRACKKLLEDAGAKSVQMFALGKTAVANKTKEIPKTGYSIQS